MTFSIRLLITMTIASVVLLENVSGFSPTAPLATVGVAKSAATTSTQLNAWSLPATNKFGTFSTSWFDVKDPTGRKVVYNDAE